MRQEQRDISDVDLLVDFDAPIELELVAFRDEIEQRLGLPIHVVMRGLLRRRIGRQILEEFQPVWPALHVPPPSDDLLSTDMNFRIVRNPEIMCGKATVSNTRLTADIIVAETAEGMTIREIIEAHPHLVEEDVRPALAYADRLPDEAKGSTTKS